jgi:hypothetical protein
MAHRVASGRQLRQRAVLRVFQLRDRGRLGLDLVCLALHRLSRQKLLFIIFLIAT